MNYKQVSIAVDTSEVSDILIALLSEEGFEGFEQQENVLIGFIAADVFDENCLSETLRPFNLGFSISDIPKTNWNREWEENFEPVIVDEFCTIRAHFHKIVVSTPYEVVITPKMSFGTGHHATTQLMVSMMGQMDFKRKSVLDFGTGTGILAILARKLGADEVVAIDHEDWACENAMENIQRNDAGNVEVYCGSLDKVDGKSFDLILANINRNILLEYMDALYANCKRGGAILMSGLLEEDESAILDAATRSGMHFVASKSQSGWIALHMSC